MEENHMGWKLVQGVRRDVVNLFKLFTKTKSVRYEDFCKVWKELNFSLIFSNRITFIEVLEFTEEILQIVKEYLLSVYEFPTRVAALYTLYGLYFKQPIKGAAKIRFTKSEWEEVQTLIKTCQAEKHFDVVFIYLKLYLSGAYNFVATIRPAGLEHGFKKYLEKRSSFAKSQSVELLYRPIVSDRLMNSLVQLESLYCKKKSQLLGKRNLVFIDGTFAKSLQEELKNYASGNQNVPSTSATESNTVTDPTFEHNTKRMGIKRKSYTSTAHSDKSQGEEEKETVGEKQEKGKGSHLQLLAKKKAEYYIKKLKEENAEEEGSNSQLSLGVLELEIT